MEQRKQPKQKKRKKKGGLLRGLYGFLVTVSVLVVIIYVVLQFGFRPPEQQVSKPVIETDPQGPKIVATSGEKERKFPCYTFLLAARDEEGGNADTIMVAMYDVKAGTVGLISIPRDTAVHTDRGTPKINSSYHYGVEKLKSEVSDLLGIPIDFYVTVEMEAFVKIVDAVGGIDFDVPVEMYHHDPVQNLEIYYNPGMQHLNGQQTLEVARFRNNADGTGYKIPDVGRGQTQQAIIKTIAKKVSLLEQHSEDYKICGNLQRACRYGHYHKGSGLFCYSSGQFGHG